MRVEYHVVPKQYPAFTMMAVTTVAASEEQALRIARDYDDEQADFAPWRILRVTTQITESEIPRSRA